MSVVVVTDSSACMPSGLVEQYGIEVVPLHVLVGEHDYRDGIDDIDLDSGPVTTSGAPPEALRAAYGAALDRSDGDGVLAVHISRQLSGTWDAARVAAEEFGGKVRLVDSQSAGMGVGFPVLAAARAAVEGAGLGSVYRHAVEAATHTSSFFVVDRLDHLRRGGRIGAAAALLGTALAMKPVLHILDGRLALKEKTRTSTKALARLTEIAVSQVEQEPVSVAVHHLHAQIRAEDLVRRLRERIPKIEEIFVTEFSAVLGAHVGPGAVGIALASHPADTAR
ncbi:DegV family protein [Rhodococcus sp. NPDC058521]|uniref:DegV family protein n=1 Tax=Rhodococcus sp. NPDC058521 TaxID=3346536 RepID=UPI003657FC0A